MPSIAYEAAHKYVKISKQASYVQANLFLSKLNKELQVADLNLSKDIRELKLFAKQKADECLRNTFNLTTEQSFDYCLSKFEKYGFSIPSDMTCLEALTLFRTEKFWFNKFKTLATQKMESIRRQLDLVNQAKSAYCSEDRLRQHQWEKEQATEFMKDKWFCSADGEYISMLDVYNANVSNPKVRRAELMVRIKGTEEYSQLQNHESWFYTLTTPSKYHSHYKSGKANPKFEQLSVKDANDYLNNQWQKARAQFDRENIKVYGLRVVEPHHDGTPHWHLMLFMPPNHSERVTQILRHYALEHEGNERGASKSRFKAEKICSEKGSAQAYIAKYVCKNIDGEFIDEDKYGNDAKTAAAKITAWASLYNIRQFQFFGLPSVSLWRQLRKLCVDIEDPQLNDLRIAADSSDWLAYLLMMGGANIPKAERPFALEYEKQIKELYEHIKPAALSKHAYNNVPKTILSGSARHHIESKQWLLLESPAERVDSPPFPWEGRTVDEVSGGSRRQLGGPPHCGEGPKSRRHLGLV
ncbi:replication endonuclease [Alteromonas sp.]|jgi:hypothetical protein|uniref:replication endonuclease n=1 Tax=Alteromonas sp. TaxID=232 RepID=UPI0032D92177